MGPNPKPCLCLRGPPHAFHMPSTCTCRRHSFTLGLQGSGLAGTHTHTHTHTPPVRWRVGVRVPCGRKPTQSSVRVRRVSVLADTHSEGHAHLRVCWNTQLCGACNKIRQRSRGSKLPCATTERRGTYLRTGHALSMPSALSSSIPLSPAAKAPLAVAAAAAASTPCLLRSERGGCSGLNKQSQGAWGIHAHACETACA